MVDPVAGGPRPGFFGAYYYDYYGVDHDWAHCSASGDGSLLPVVAGRVGEVAAWTGCEVRVVHQAQVDTE